MKSRIFIRNKTKLCKLLSHERRLDVLKIAGRNIIALSFISRANVEKLFDKPIVH